MDSVSPRKDPSFFSGQKDQRPQLEWYSFAERSQIYQLLENTIGDKTNVVLARYNIRDVAKPATASCTRRLVMDHVVFGAFVVVDG